MIEPDFQNQKYVLNRERRLKARKGIRQRIMGGRKI
jgi:hypothetical protein